MKHKNNKIKYIAIILGITVLILLFMGTRQSMLITGSNNVLPGTTQTYTLSLDAGTQVAVGAYRYANWALVSTNNVVVQQGTWETVNQVYQKNISITFPNTIANYALVSSIYEYRYNTATLLWDAGTVIAKEAFSISVQPNNPPQPGWGSILAAIWSWIIGLFGWK